MADIYAFGSMVSGEFDEGSDTDILAIESPDENNRYPPEWSVYSQERIEELFRRGTLFAWHIYLEAVPISRPDKVGFLGTLDPPATYDQAHHEIQALYTMAKDALNELASGTPSWIYELGILGVAIRDIGMAASKALTDSFCFSKHAPYLIKGPTLPICKEDYCYLIACRRATTRGRQVDNDDERRLRILSQSTDILRWCCTILTEVRDYE